MDLIGQRLGNYRLVRLLGEGGYAQVYLGEHVILTMQAAIKVVHDRFSERDIARFLQEARAVAHLHHPHIVRLLEFAVAEGRPYLAMEYAPGGSLRQRHPDGIPLELTMIERYVQQIAKALQYAHDQKLIHRDVKPENILIGAQGQLLLADFGFALLTPSSSHLLSAQDVGGTAAYMAPEQLQGHPRRASDQYALGVMVFEWLTGKALFSGSVPEMVAQHLYKIPRSPRELVPSITRPVEEVVLRALMKDPKVRFPSVQAFATAFASACQTTVYAPFTTYPVTARHPVTRPAPAHAVAREASALPPAQPQEEDPIQPVPELAPLAPVEHAESAAPGTAANSIRLERRARTKRVTLRWRPFHLLPLHMGLIVLVLILAAGGGTLWLTRFQQTVVTSKYVTRIQVAAGFDRVSGVAQGVNDTFQAGTSVVLVCTMRDWEGPLETRLFQGDALIATQDLYVFAMSAPVFSSTNLSVSVKLAKSGRYLWVVDLLGTGGNSLPGASITFQITS